MAFAARQQKQDGGSRYVKDRATIERAFRQFRDQRTKLQLRFDGAGEAFTATILDVTDDNVLLEDIVPRSGLSHLRNGTPFSLAGRGQGVYVYVERVRCTKSDSERGVPYFWIELPKSVLYQQRRKAARVELPLRVKAQGARIRIIHDDLELVGDLLDLSAGGVRAQFLGQQDSVLQTEQTLDSCILHIRDQLDLHSEATVRHVLLDRRNAVLNCGLELTKMHVTDRRRLEHYVQSLAKQSARQSG